MLKHYRQSDFSHDLIAGLVVGVITIPQAIAYAILAGLPAQAGLYACLVPMLLYAALGSSRHMVVGPVAVAALMVAAAIGTYGPRYGDAHLALSTVLCLQAGLFLWLLRLFQMGGLVNLLSHPVIIGFVNAAAVMIIVSQLSAFTGAGTGAAGDPLHQLLALPDYLRELSLPTFAMGVACLAALLIIQHRGIALLRRLGLDLPDDHPVARTGPIVVTLLATIAVVAWNLDGGSGVAVVGFVPPGLPDLVLPPFQWRMWIDLAPSAAMIAVVAYVESYSIGASLATRRNTRVNAHQELIALGAANIGAAFTGAYPVAGSFSRSSVNFQAGARTPVSSLVSAVVIVLTLLFFTPLFARLPHAALAATIVVSVLGIIDIGAARRHWRTHRPDSITELVTFGTVVGFGVEAGLLTGVALSIAFFVRQSSRPHIAQVGRVGTTGQFRNIRRHEVETLPHVAAIRIDENIFFANANQVENKLLKIVQRRPGTREVLLVCSAVNRIDISGLEMLHRINRNFAAMGVRLHLSDVKGPVMDQLAATDFVNELTGRVFFSADQAMRELATPD
ncbi:MAG: sulfate permease [Pseudomonadales bacterium]|nr:sulfate permease [Pseudomonadales bacterium]